MGIQTRWTGTGALALGALLLIYSVDVLAQRGRPAPPPDRVTVIHAGRLLAVPGEAPTEKASLILRNDRVESVESGFVTTDSLGEAQQAQLIDLSDRFVLPGLMDAHVHLRGEPTRSRGRARRGARAEDTYAEKAFNAVLFARRNLAAGFTTVRDVGSDDQSIFAVRDGINNGRMIGPRILISASSLAVTGGHGDSSPVLETGDPNQRLLDGLCDGPMECRRAVRFQWKLGADLIKFTSTAGFGSNTGLERQLFPDEIQAIVETAHLLGMKVATHAYAPDAIKLAVEAGVDSVEHGFLLDDEGIALMKKKSAYLVPTLSASYPPPIFRIPNPESVRLRNEYRAFERAYEAGVNIAFGTDAGTFSHGQNAKEFELMVEFGMSEMDAIHSATVSTAALFGIADEAGTLEPGKLADLIAVTGDPLTDITAFREIDFVMKSGRVAKQAGRMTEPFSYPAFKPDYR